MAEIRAIGVGKRYGSARVLAEVDFDLQGGEIHALVGENGAGKSTLIKILSGLVPATEGRVVVDGVDRHRWGLGEAASHGVATVHQEVRLVPHLSVAENVMLGREPRGRLGIDWAAMRRAAALALERLGLDLDPRAELGSLGVPARQMVAIARALDAHARFLILDEPTSSLDAAEVSTLFARLRGLRSEGLGILFITHFLDQVDEIADRITVLRNGRAVGTWRTGELTRRGLVEQMVGRDVADLESRERGAGAGERLLEVQGPIGLTVGAGEIVGLAGLLGSGRTETLRRIFALDRPKGVLWVGQPAAWRSPRGAARSGLALIPEDRRSESIFPGLSVGDNVRLALDAQAGWFSSRRAPDVAGWMASVGVRPANPAAPIESLSGGNQQKAVLARWLMIQPKLLMLDEPTRGIDVNAKFEVLRRMADLRDAGSGVLMASSETAEIARVCDRAVVLHEGRSVREIEDPDEDALIHSMSGEPA